MSVQVSGDKITFSDNSVLGSAWTGFKNRIINGGFVVSQYNGTNSFTATTGGLRYGIDRFFMYCAGANLTGQQITGTNTGTYKAWKITGATGSTLLNFAQRIESLNTTDLANQTVTVSVKVYCSTAISGASIYALVPTAQDNYASTTTSFSTSITLSAGLNTISVTGTIGSAGANGVEVGIGFGSGVGNGVTAEVASFQIEKCTVATSFDYRPYGTELALCQRYYEVGRYTTIQQSSNGFGVGSTQSFAVVKRAIPTMVYTNFAVSGVSATATDWNTTTSNFGVYHIANATGNVQYGDTFTASAEL